MIAELKIMHSDVAQLQAKFLADEDAWKYMGIQLPSLLRDCARIGISSEVHAYCTEAAERGKKFELATTAFLEAIGFPRDHEGPDHGHDVVCCKPGVEIKLQELMLGVQQHLSVIQHGELTRVHA